MKKNSKLCIGILLVMIILINFLSIVNISYGAANYTISSGLSSIEEGKTYSIKIKANGLTGRFNISHSSNVSVNCSSIWIENGVADSTVKVTAKSAGKATVTFSPDTVANASNGDLVQLSSKTDTVEVKSKTSSTSNGNTETKLNFSKTNKTVYAKDDINLRSSWSTSSSATPVSKGTEMTLTGTSSRTINGYTWYRVTYKGTTKYVASSLVTTTNPNKSNDIKTNNDKKNTTEEKNTNNTNSVNLKSLVVTPTGLSPAFSTGTTEYTMNVGSNINKIDVKAIAESSSAKVSIEGNKNLKIGKNKITITVTGSDKTSKLYNITVTKENKKQLQLSELLVEGLPLEPAFDSNVYEYTIKLDNKDITELNITATSDDSKAQIEIVGNTDLKQGENLVTILVKSNDKEEISTYQITVIIPQEKVQEIVEENNQDKKIYMGIALGLILFIVLIIITIVKKHKNNVYEEEEEEYTYNPVNKEKDTLKNVQKEINDSPKVNIDDLPKLRDEELPKSLRKSEHVENIINDVDNNQLNIKEKEEITISSDRKKQIDEFYSNVTDEIKSSKKGKHSK